MLQAGMVFCIVLENRTAQRAMVQNNTISYICSVVNKTNIFILISFFSFLQCTSQKEITSNRCDTKYPILLVHGIAYRDDIPFLKYWSRIPKKLEKQGATVYLAHQDAFNSHIENALQVKERINEVLEKTGSEKVNIIAHSKGGIESRYVITKLGMADKVASLTTLATPHRGSALADTIFAFLERRNFVDQSVKLIRKYARFIGDKEPNIFLAGKNLTVEYMAHFNQSVPNMPIVYYQSYGGVVTENYPAWHIRIQHKLMDKAEGKNDCIVSKDSYQWGNFKGVATSNDDFGVSHFDIVGMRFVSQVSSFDADHFIINIVKELKERGY
ncbi:MAG: alpha/beta fold hydrolase [Bacteroidota bacterium]